MAISPPELKRDRKKGSSSDENEICQDVSTKESGSKDSKGTGANNGASSDILTNRDSQSREDLQRASTNAGSNELEDSAKDKSRESCEKPSTSNQCESKSEDSDLEESKSMGTSHRKRHRPTTRSNYSPEVTKVLMEWFENNLDNPYPCESDRIKMCRATGLSRKQLRVWLINARKRKLDKAKKETMKKRDEKGMDKDDDSFHDEYSQ